MSATVTIKSLEALTNSLECAATFSLFQTLQCPYCGEEVEISAEAQGATDEKYVEDCSVCCRPWTVHIHRDEGGEVDVVLLRDDD